MKTEAGASWNSRSMSDLGVIATSMNFVVTSDNSGGDIGDKTLFKAVRLDGGYGAIGPIMFGWTASTFDPGGGYTYDGAIRSDMKVDQFRLSYLMGTWGIMLGLEDPRDRYDAKPKNATGNYPDVVLAVTGGVGGLDIRAAVAVTDRTSGTGWGATCRHRQARRRRHQGQRRLFDNAKSLTAQRRLELQRRVRRRRVVERVPVGRRGAQRQHEARAAVTASGARVAPRTAERRRAGRRGHLLLPDGSFGDRCGAGIRQSGGRRRQLAGSIKFKTHFNSPNRTGPKCPAEASAGHFLFVTGPNGVDRRLARSAACG